MNAQTPAQKELALMIHLRDRMQIYADQDKLQRNFYLSKVNEAQRQINALEVLVHGQTRISLINRMLERTWIFLQGADDIEMARQMVTSGDARYGWSKRAVTFTDAARKFWSKFK